MSEYLEQAAAQLNEKMAGQSFDGSAKFDFEGDGSIVLDGSGARVGDEETEVTLTADQDTFQSIFEGELNPTSAFMAGKLKIDGDMGTAMKLASVLA